MINWIHSQLCGKEGGVARGWECLVKQPTSRSRQFRSCICANRVPRSHRCAAEQESFSEDCPLSNSAALFLKSTSTREPDARLLWRYPHSLRKRVTPALMNLTVSLLGWILAMVLESSGTCRLRRKDGPRAPALAILSHPPTKLESNYREALL